MKCQPLKHAALLREVWSHLILLSIGDESGLSNEDAANRLAVVFEDLTGNSLEELDSDYSQLEQLIEKKRGGEDITEDESRFVLNYMTDRTDDEALRDELAEIFPLEVAQWDEQTPIRNARAAHVESVQNPECLVGSGHTDSQSA